MMLRNSNLAIIHLYSTESLGIVVSNSQESPSAVGCLWFPAGAQLPHQATPRRFIAQIIVVITVLGVLMSESKSPLAASLDCPCLVSLGADLAIVQGTM